MGDMVSDTGSRKDDFDNELMKQLRNEVEPCVADSVWIFVEMDPLAAHGVQNRQFIIGMGNNNATGNGRRLVQRNGMCQLESPG